MHLDGHGSVIQTRGEDLNYGHLASYDSADKQKQSSIKHSGTCLLLNAARRRNNGASLLYQLADGESIQILQGQLKLNSYNSCNQQHETCQTGYGVGLVTYIGK